jgi:hypothetical protein
MPGEGDVTVKFLCESTFDSLEKFIQEKNERWRPLIHEQSFLALAIPPHFLELLSNRYFGSVSVGIFLFDNS